MLFSKIDVMMKCISGDGLWLRDYVETLCDITMFFVQLIILESERAREVND